jgi:hypothetical protein
MRRFPRGCVAAARAEAGARPYAQAMSGSEAPRQRATRTLSHVGFSSAGDESHRVVRNSLASPACFFSSCSAARGAPGARHGSLSAAPKLDSLGQQCHVPLPVNRRRRARHGVYVARTVRVSLTRCLHVAHWSSSARAAGTPTAVMARNSARHTLIFDIFPTGRQGAGGLSCQLPRKRDGGQGSKGQVLQPVCAVCSVLRSVVSLGTRV